jgi:hypothetical protein
VRLSLRGRRKGIHRLADSYPADRAEVESPTAVECTKGFRRHQLGLNAQHRDLDSRKLESEFVV